MKNLLLWGVAAVCMLASACSKESVDENRLPPSVNTQRLYVEDETTAQEAKSESRAGFDGNGYRIVWSESDEVMVNGAVYPLQKGPDGSWYVEVASAEKYVAYYPASAYAERDGKVYMQLPSNLTFTAGTFDPKAFCARAEAVAGGKLQFKYLCSLVKFTVQGVDATSAVRIFGNNEEIIAGYCEVVQDTDGEYILEPLAEFDGTAQTGLTSQSYIASQLTNEGTAYYYVIPPTVFSKGISLEVQLTDKSMQTKAKSSSVTLARADILAMPAFRFEEVSAVIPVYYSADNLNWKLWKYTDENMPETLPYPETENHRLYFKDNVQAAAKGLTLAHFQSLHDTFMKNGDANGNNYETVKAVKPIGFDFSRATYESETLPTNIFTRYGDADKKYNTDLRYISLPKNIKVIASGSFIGDLVLHTVILPETVEQIGASAFEVARGLHAMGDDPDPATQGIFCYAMTPPSFGKDAFNWNSLIFHVPEVSLEAYNEVWATDPLGARLSRAKLVGDL